jgi:glycosyltransferase involved in cell wall biosynthesis
MKILRIIARLNVGGPARHVVWLTQQLDRDGFESKLIAGSVPKGEESMNYLAEEYGIEPIFIEEMSRELSPKDLISLIKIYREIRRQRPDVIHTHTAKAGTVGRAAAFLYRLFNRAGRDTVVIHTFHGHVFHSYYGALKTRVFVAIERLLARFATDKIIVISPQQLNEIHEQVGIGRRDQFEIIPLGIDIATFTDRDEDGKAWRGRNGIGVDDIAIGFVGRLTEIKDVSLYLQVAAEVLQQDAPAKMRFVVIGDGHLRGQLEREAEALSLGDAVMFVGNETDIAAAYSALDIVALTSRNEGTPLSLIEAMAAGRPVISTMVGGVRDLLGPVIEDHKDFVVCERGIGIETRSPADYTKGLLYLAENEKLRESLAANGQAYVTSEYSRERLVDDIARLYQTLASKN